MKRKTLTSVFLAVALIAGTALASEAQAAAGGHSGPGHEARGGTCVSPLAQGARAAPGSTGSGMTGGPGMGPGTMGGYGMGPGMTGGYGAGPGMMGGHGMHAMMGGTGTHGAQAGPGRTPGALHRDERDLSLDDVRELLQHRLEHHGNDRLRVGKVEPRSGDDQVIVAEIETVDGSLVERFEVDRHTGAMQRVP